MLINLVVVVIFALLNGVEPSWSWLLVPLSILEIYILSLGISFLLGALNVKYRDATSIWDVCTQALFYAAPIIYPISMVAEINVTAAKALLVNPIAQVIQDVRYNLITHETITSWNYIANFWLQIIPIAIVVILFIVGILYFRKKSKSFAEDV